MDHDAENPVLITRMESTLMTSLDTSFSQTGWSLADLFPSPDGAEMQAAFEELDSLVSDFEGLRPQLTASIPSPDFLAIVRQLESITYRAHLVSSYAGLWFSQDTQNQAAQGLVARVDQFMAGLKNRTLFFELWWKGLEDDDAERLMAKAGDYRYWLEEMRHYKPHTLSESEERIVNVKDVTGVNAFHTLYDLITNRYVFGLEVDGEVQELTRDQLASYVRHPDADLRTRAYQELHRVYQQDGPILGQIYQTLVRDWRNEQIDLRNFASPMAVRNLDNDIPDEVVDTLLEVCQGNSSLFHRFFRLKAAWLGVDKLRRYDLYAPVAGAEKTYAFADAVEMVLDSFRCFDSRIAELARRVLVESHLNSEIRKGKRGGAFCWSVAPDRTPWVLTNYQGRPRDVATLAHELGHAIHTMLAADHSILTFHASLPLAETASTFGEILLIDRLLAEEGDEAVRRDALFYQVDDYYATILRQAFFALFERQAHHMVEQGSSVDDLAEAYMDNLHTQFGDAVELSDEFRWEWIAIPHIYQVPFYVYAYAFGQLLVLSLYQQYQSEGDAFKPRYLNILAAGGSQAPARILAEGGFDIHRADFWQGGFDVIRVMVEQLEEIPRE